MASSPSTKPQKLTESGLARELGVSRQAVHDLVKRGILEKDSDGLIDVAAAKRALLENVRPSGKTSISLQDSEERIKLFEEEVKKEVRETKPEDSPSEGSEITSYHVAKTLREAAEAQIARLKLAEMQGKYLIKEDFERHLFTAGRMLRDTLTNCSRRIGAEVAGTTNPDECETIIDREHRAALASFAQALRMSLKVNMETPV